MADADATEPETGAASPTGETADVKRDWDPGEPMTATAPPKKRGRLPKYPRGTAMGRYVLLDELGRGGMGDVYAAFDPELDRRIALKLVRDVTGDGSERLIAEAKTMARVAHPHVCTVYDAGRFDEGVFIAMELIEGETLGEWRKTPRTRREILDVFAAAGRGLCAAHAAGIVHRDFKPGNVIIGRDGRVRVVDFGLARVGMSSRNDSTDSMPPTPSTPDLMHLPDRAPDLTSSLERTPDDDGEGPRVMASRAMGTPSYMPPEQRRPGVHDARVDQYAFAVALYETLYGERPFEGKNSDEIATNALAHRIRPPPRESDVPAWLRRPLVRALSPDPRDRFASLEALLAELARDPAARRRRIGVAVVAVAILGGLVFAAVRRDATNAPCRGADRPVAGLWDRAAQGKVADAFRATKRSYADSWSARVGAELGTRVRALGAARIAACEATSVRREQSPALMDLRMACLGRRAGELEALITRLGAEPDPALMDHALDAIAALPSLDACADATALLSLAPRPRDHQAELTAAEAAVAEVRAAAYAADVRKTRQRATEAVSLAERAGWSPLLAEALVADADAALVATDLHGVDETIYRATRLAAEARADRTLTEAWITGVRALTALGRPQEALALAHAADAALARIERPGPLRAQLLGAEAMALEATGEFAAAMARDDEAVALRTRDGAPDDLAAADLLNHRAILSSRQGDHAAAEALHRRVLAMRTSLLGDRHPDVASSLDNLGAVVYHQGRLDEAQTFYQQALTLRLEMLGPVHEDVGTSFNNLGGVFLDRGDLGGADEHFTRAIATWEKVLGPDHPSLAIALGNLGDVALLRGDPERARSLCHRAYELEARASGDRSPELAYSLTCEGEALTAAGRAAAATDVLERALALREAAAVDASELARTRLALAAALAAQHAQPARVRQLATAARDVLRTAGASWAARAAAADRLLARGP